MTWNNVLYLLVKNVLENLNLSTKYVPSIYYSVLIIYYSSKNLIHKIQKILFSELEVEA